MMVEFAAFFLAGGVTAVACRLLFGPTVGFYMGLLAVTIASCSNTVMRSF